MTIASTTAWNGYIGSGSTGPFSVGFALYNQAHLEVVTITVSSGLETTLVLNVDYTFTQWTPSTTGQVTNAQITLTNALATGTNLALILNPPGTQLLDIKDQYQFFAPTHEVGYDLDSQKLLALQEQVNKSLKAPDGEQASSLTMTIPPIAVRANQIASYDANGNSTTLAPSSLPASPITSLGSSIINSTYWYNVLGFLNVPYIDQTNDFTSLGASINNFTPTNWGPTIAIVEINNTTQNTTLTGMAKPTISNFAQRVTLWNLNNHTLTLSSNSGSSLGGNRFILDNTTNAYLTIGNNGSVDLIYSYTQGAWIVINA